MAVCEDDLGDRRRIDAGRSQVFGELSGCLRHEFSTGTDVDEDQVVADLEDRDVHGHTGTVRRVSEPLGDLGELLGRRVGRDDVERQHELAVADYGDLRVALREAVRRRQRQRQRLPRHQRHGRECRTSGKEAAAIQQMKHFLGIDGCHGEAPCLSPRINVYKGNAIPV